MNSSTKSVYFLEQNKQKLYICSKEINGSDIIMMSYWGSPSNTNMKLVHIKVIFGQKHHLLIQLFCIHNKLNIMNFNQEYTIYFLQG